jgi:hypothetical protein
MIRFILSETAAAAVVFGAAALTAASSGAAAAELGGLPNGAIFGTGNSSFPATSW